jgi:fatty acid desaturase
VSTTVFTTDEQQAIIEKGWVWRMLCLPLAAIGLYCLAWHWPIDHWSVRLFWTLITSYFLFCWTSCFHETAHQTLTRWRWFDIALGRILGTVIFVPYTIYREAHIRHHAYVNRPNDWELWPYSQPECSLGFRRVFVLFDVVFGFVAAPYIYSRIFFHRDSPLKKPETRRAVWAEYSAIVLFWGYVYGRLKYTATWEHYVTVWLVPHMIAGVFQTTRKLTEHLGMASFDPLLGTRTVIGTTWVTRLASFMNFDIFVHGPHHRFPRVAHNRLQDRMVEQLTDRPGEHFPLYSSYLRATCDMLPYLFRNPGIGMHAGAPAPEPERVADVTNFSADVVHDVHGAGVLDSAGRIVVSRRVSHASSA